MKTAASRCGCVRLNSFFKMVLVYFAGINDFAEYLRLQPENKLAQLADIFEKMLKSDSKFAETGASGKIKKTECLSYYGFRANAEFSTGSHDEWNLIDAIDSSRRGADQKERVARQIPSFFNGQEIQPGDSELVISRGNAKL
jgi:hypothetical protein